MMRDGSLSPGAVSSITLSLLAAISAIEFLTKGGTSSLGMISELPARTTLELCGDGFNDRTVKVRVSGWFFYVFWEDIEPCGPFVSAS